MEGGGGAPWGGPWVEGFSGGEEVPGWRDFRVGSPWWGAQNLAGFLLPLFVSFFLVSVVPVCNWCGVWAIYFQFEKPPPKTRKARVSQDVQGA